jgi:hypothetical protein
MNPGYTVKPLPSITQASAGIARLAPTAWIKPSRTNTVAFGKSSPLTVTT